jgi:tRNA A37 threonylcarbamoyladenosine dehydratase
MRVMNHDFRFGGIQRLYGNRASEKLRKAHIAIIGLGGVGSWVFESLVRSGVGKFSLVDMDEVCESNINRQIQALSSSVGKAKTSSLIQRAKDINPEAEYNEIFDFFTAESCEEILSQDFDVVIDCIDSMKNKCLLLAECKKRNISVISCGGAGGRRDPFKVSVADLSKTHGDKMLAKLRKKLRKEYGFKTNGSNFKIPCVFSSEEVYYPTSDSCVTKEKQEMESTRLDCSSGFGAVTHLTGSFGFAMAHLAIQEIIRD